MKSRPQAPGEMGAHFVLYSAFEQEEVPFVRASAPESFKQLWAQDLKGSWFVWLYAFEQ